MKKTFFFRDFYVRTLKIMRNVQKSDLEKMSEWMFVCARVCVCVCV